MSDNKDNDTTFKKIMSDIEDEVKKKDKDTTTSKDSSSFEKEIGISRNFSEGTKVPSEKDSDIFGLSDKVELKEEPSYEKITPKIDDEINDEVKKTKVIKEEDTLPPNLLEETKENKKENIPKQGQTGIKIFLEDKEISQDAISKLKIKEEKKEEIKQPTKEDSQKTALFNFEFKPRLEVVAGSLAKKIYYLEKDLFTLGRAQESDLVLMDASCSRNHAKISRKGTGFFLEDLGSTNGVSINGRKIFKERLNTGDIISIGDISLKFHAGAAKDAQTHSTKISIVEIDEKTKLKKFSFLKLFSSKKLQGTSKEKKRKMAIYVFFIGCMLFVGYFNYLAPYLESLKAAKSQIEEASKQETAPEQTERDRTLSYLLNQGNYLYNAGNYEEAREKFEQALQIMPENEEIRTMKEKSEAAIALKQEMEEKKSKEIETQEASKNITALENKAMELYNQGNYASALSTLQTLKGIDPNNEIAKKYIPLIESQKSKESQTKMKETKQQQSVSEGIKVAKKYYDDGDIYGGIQQLKKLQKDDIDRSIKDEIKNYIDAWETELTNKLKSKLEVARTFWENGERKQARKLLKEILTQYPDYKEAKQFNDDVLQKIQEEAFQLYNDGRVYESNDDVNAAIENYEKVLAITEPNDEYYIKAKEKLERLKRFNEGL